jgi:titin
MRLNDECMKRLMDASRFKVSRTLFVSIVVFFLSGIATQVGITNPKPGTTDRNRVRAIGSKIGSVYSQIGAATTQTPRRPIPEPKTLRTRTPPTGAPAAPSNLMASAVSTTQINLTWTTSNANNVTGFYVERATAAKGPWKRVTTLSSNTASSGNGGLDASTTYYYRLIAYNSAGNSAYSNVASATTHSMLPQGAPSHLTAKSGGATQINLSWTNNAGDATNLQIERCQNPGCSNFNKIASVGADATSFHDTGLSPSVSYSYRVLANNSTMKSGYSNTATANTARNTNPPTVPTGLTATVVSSTRIKLTWTQSTGNGSEVGGYNVYQAGSRIASTIGTSYSVNGLDAKTQYCYTVTAFDRSGNASSQSDPACATTKSPDDP